MRASSGILKVVSKMKPGLSFLSISAIAAALILFSCRASTQPNSQEQQVPSAYLGFDLNIFPGKDALPVLRKTFSFSSYWLSPPPGEKTNTWLGQRELLRVQGFGFLLLYRGPLSRELKERRQRRRRELPTRASAASVAKSEGFPVQAIIFLDIEEGGRLPAAYHAYLHAWAADSSARLSFWRVLFRNSSQRRTERHDHHRGRHPRACAIAGFRLFRFQRRLSAFAWLHLSA